MVSGLRTKLWLPAPEKSNVVRRRGRTSVSATEGDPPIRPDVERCIPSWSSRWCPRFHAGGVAARRWPRMRARSTLTRGKPRSSRASARDLLERQRGLTGYDDM